MGGAVEGVFNAGWQPNTDHDVLGGALGFYDDFDDLGDVFGDWAQSYGDAQTRLGEAGEAAMGAAATQETAEENTRRQRYRDAYFSGSSQAPTVLNGGD